MIRAKLDNLIYTTFQSNKTRLVLLLLAFFIITIPFFHGYIKYTRLNALEKIKEQSVLKSHFSKYLSNSDNAK